MFHIGPLLFVGLRCVIAAAVLLPFALREQHRAATPFRRIAPIAVLAGLIFFAAASVQQHGIVTATVINTGFLTALYVVVTPFAFWAIERQRPTAIVWIATGIAFSGVWALAGGSLGYLSRGDVLIAVATIGWGIHFVITGRAGRLARPITYTCTEFAVVALIALTAAVWFEQIDVTKILDAMDSIVYVGVLSTALTFGLMSTAMQHVPAPKASILLSTEVVFSAAAGYLLLGERLSVLGWFGASLIVAAVLLVRLRPAR